MRALDEYIARTERWRSGEEYSQLLLSFIHPHKPVIPSAVSRGLKTIPMKQGVDTGTFKAPPTRSASIFKVGLQGASVDDILEYYEEGQIFIRSIKPFQLRMKDWTPCWDKRVKFGKRSMEAMVDDSFLATLV